MGGCHHILLEMCWWWHGAVNTGKGRLFGKLRAEWLPSERVGVDVEESGLFAWVGR